MPNELFVYMTAKDAAQANKLGRALVERKLAACVNLLPKMSSLYRWKGKIEQAQEVVLIAKTTRSCWDRLLETVKELHSYECPCVVALPLALGNPDYLAWIRESCAP